MCSSQRHQKQTYGTREAIAPTGCFVMAACEWYNTLLKMGERERGAEHLDPMDKMWVSFIGIGLMALAAAVVTFARLKTKGWVRLVLTLIAFVLLVFGVIYGAVSIL